MKKCPFCAEEIQDEAIVCRYCGRDLPVVSSTQNTPYTSEVLNTQNQEGEINQPLPAQKNDGRMIIFAFIILALVLWVTSQLNSKSSSSISSSGDTVSLYYGGVEILCGVTEQDYKDIIDTLVNKDNVGFNELFSSGRAFMVDSGTKALVLERRLTAAKVRIMEGVYKDQIAWVAIEAIDK